MPAPGTGVPTLDQVCRLVTESGADHVTLAVELKTSPGWPAADVARITRLAVDIVMRYGLASRTRILAFNWQVLLTARTEAPEIPRVALVEPATWVPGSPWLAGLDPAGFGADETGLAEVTGCAAAAASIAAAWLSPWDPMCGAELIGAAHDRDLKVVPWTVNEPGRMAELIGHGVDAIVTDDPAVLRAEPGRAGAALPAARALPWPSGVPSWAPRPFPG